MTTKQIFEFSYWWSQELGTNDQHCREIGIASEAAVDWRNFFRDICAEFFIRHPVQIGGQGLFNTTLLNSLSHLFSLSAFISSLYLLRVLTL